MSDLEVFLTLAVGLFGLACVVALFLGCALAWVAREDDLKAERELRDRQRADEIARRLEFSFRQPSVEPKRVLR